MFKTVASTTRVVHGLEPVLYGPGAGVAFKEKTRCGRRVDASWRTVIPAASLTCGVCRRLLLDAAGNMVSSGDESGDGGWVDA